MAASTQVNSTKQDLNSLCPAPVLEFVGQAGAQGLGAIEGVEAIALVDFGQPVEEADDGFLAWRVAIEPAALIHVQHVGT